ncbi:MAG: hypothetical protein WC510_08335, partial [Candidatus Omnitrophota bacterium]
LGVLAAVALVVGLITGLNGFDAVLLSTVAGIAGPVVAGVVIVLGFLMPLVVSRYSAQVSQTRNITSQALACFLNSFILEPAIETEWQMHMKALETLEKWLAASGKTTGPPVVACYNPATDNIEYALALRTASDNLNEALIKSILTARGFTPDGITAALAYIEEHEGLHQAYPGLSEKTIFVLQYHLNTLTNPQTETNMVRALIKLAFQDNPEAVRVFRGLIPVFKELFHTTEGLELQTEILDALRYATSHGIPEAATVFKELFLETDNPDHRIKILKYLLGVLTDDTPKEVLRVFEEFFPIFKELFLTTDNIGLQSSILETFTYIIYHDIPNALTALKELFLETDNPELQIKILEVLRFVAYSSGKVHLSQAIEELIPALKELFLETDNPELQIKILEVLRHTAFRGGDEASQAIEELIPALKELFLATDNLGLQINILEVLRFAASHGRVWASQAIEELIPALKELFLETKNPELQIEIIGVLRYTDSLGASQAIEELIPALKELFLETKNPELRMNILEVLNITVYYGIPEAIKTIIELVSVFKELFWEKVARLEKIAILKILKNAVSRSPEVARALKELLTGFIAKAGLTSLLYIDFHGSGDSRNSWLPLSELITLDKLKFLPLPEGLSLPLPQQKVEGDKLPSYENIKELLGAIGIDAQYYTTLGRKVTYSLQGENGNTRYIALKMMRGEGETPADLKREGNWLSFLNKAKKLLPLQGTWARPLSLTQQEGSFLARVKVADRERQSTTPNLPGKPSGVYQDTEGYCIVLVTEETLETLSYLDQKKDIEGNDITPERFKAASLVALHDLFVFLRYGIIHPDLIELYHDNRKPTGDNIGSNRIDAGVYSWRLWGRLEAWLKASTYSNFRLSGFADLANFTTIEAAIKDTQSRRFVAIRRNARGTGDWVYEYAGAYLLSILLVKAAWMHNTNRLNWGDKAEIGLLSGQAREFFYISMQIYVTAGKTPVDVGAVSAAINQMLDVFSWDILARQMAYFMSGAYAEDFLQPGALKKVQVFYPGAEVNLPTPAKLLEEAEDWGGFTRDKGWSLDGRFSDLGSPNGKNPLQELNRALTLAFALMMLVDDSAYAQESQTPKITPQRSSTLCAILPVLGIVFYLAGIAGPVVAGIIIVLGVLVPLAVSSISGQSAGTGANGGSVGTKITLKGIIDEENLEIIIQDKTEDVAVFIRALAEQREYDLNIQDEGCLQDLNSMVSFFDFDSVRVIPMQMISEKEIKIKIVYNDVGDAHEKQLAHFAEIKALVDAIAVIVPMKNMEEGQAQVSYALALGVLAAVALVVGLITGLNGFDAVLLSTVAGIA